VHHAGRQPNKQVEPSTSDTTPEKMKATYAKKNVSNATNTKTENQKCHINTHRIKQNITWRILQIYQTRG
jgi:uncharacterized protein YifN (PemK superfamily)